MASAPNTYAHDALFYHVPRNQRKLVGRSIVYSIEFISHLPYTNNTILYVDILSIYLV
jgi:hypothetical protein